MAYQKLQTERAIKVFPTTIATTVDSSKAATIPNPGRLLVSGSTATTVAATGAATNNATLTKTGETFVTKGVKIGDVVRITISTTIKDFYIVGVTETVLTLRSGTGNSTDNVSASSAASYEVYPNREAEPCVLYVGGAGNLDIITEGEDRVTLVGVPAGTFIPVQVRAVVNNENSSGTPTTTATEIIALR